MITASRSIRFKSGALRRGPQPEVRGLCESEQLTARNRSIHFKSGVKDAYGGVVIGRWCGVWEFQMPDWWTNPEWKLDGTLV